MRRYFTASHQKEDGSAVTVAVWVESGRGTEACIKVFLRDKDMVITRSYGGCGMVNALRELAIEKIEVVDWYQVAKVLARVIDEIATELRVALAVRELDHTVGRVRS